MSLFSFLRKNKQESTSSDGEFYSRAEDESQAVHTRGKRKAKQVDESSDPILPEKKRARRRLIGAIALVLAAIIGLPMILDSEPKPLAEDISIQIPSKDNSKPLSIEPPAAARPVPTASALEPVEQIIEPSPAVDKSAARAVADEKPTLEKVAAKAKEPIPAEKTKPTSDKVADAKTASNAIHQVEQKSGAKSDTKVTASQADEAARARAILEGKFPPRNDPAKAVSDTKSGKFAVQVAALATQDKINELRSKLNSAGIQSYTQKVATQSGERTRIRVGPFATKEEAEKMRGKLVKMGLNGTLVPPHS